jgi:GTP1/Obg family GTP-binding protein
VRIRYVDDWLDAAHKIPSCLHFSRTLLQAHALQVKLQSGKRTGKSKTRKARTFNKERLHQVQDAMKQAGEEVMAQAPRLKESKKNEGGSAPMET